jgi:hypothetical protein
MIDTENSADLGFAHSMQSLKDIKDINLLFTAYGFEADCSCVQSPSLGSLLLDHPLGSFTDNLNDQMQIKGFAHVRDREEFAGVLNQAGNYFDGLHGSETPDQVLGFSSATGHGPDDVESSMKSEQDIFEFLNRSASGQIQGSGSKGTSGFSGVSLSGSDSVTGIGNNQGSSESDLWGRIEGSIADQHNTSPAGEVTSCDLESIGYVAAALICTAASSGTAAGICAASFASVATARRAYCEAELEEYQLRQAREEKNQQSSLDCPTDPDDESGIYTGPRTNPIDLSQGDLGQGNPEDGSFGPEFTVPWHSYESDRPTLLDITGQPSERDVSNQKSERRGFTIDPVINPIPDGV